jgi:flagellar biosynthesis/type III secretory pathway protein FliH
LFELTEHVRVRRKGADRYVRINDLPAVRRYAPQAPDEEDLKRDMPTGRFVLRAYSVRSDIEWQHEWTETQAGEFAGMATTIADYLKDTESVLLKEMEAADQRARERRAVYEEELRQRKARERAEALQRARQAAKEELRSIVRAWNDAFALEAFFTELSLRAERLSGEAREALDSRIQTARDLMGGQDAVARFLRWTLPSDPPDALDGDGDGDEDADEAELEDQ